MRLAGLSAALALALAAPAAAQEVALELRPDEVLIQVEAEGIHKVRPDMMAIRAGVVTTGDSALEALAANSTLAGRLIEAVRANGIDPRDVRTSELTVSPRLSRRDRADEEDLPPRILGYIARNQLELNLRDLEKAPGIINALFAAGANEVRGPMFGVSDEDSALREARRAAVLEAAKEARDYADALGMKVARVLRVSERGEFEVGDGMIVVTGSRIVPTPVEPGELQVKTEVWIDYALVPR